MSGGVLALHKDKTALYTQYPQLLEPPENPCLHALGNMLINHRSDPRSSAMWSSQAVGLADLGSQSLCENEGQGKYATYGASVTYVPSDLLK